MTLRRGVAKPTLFLVVWLSLPRQSPTGFAVPQLLSAFLTETFGPLVGQIWKQSRRQSHMAACSPSRYVAEVRGVSNPQFFGLPKHERADMAAEVAMPTLQVETVVGKYLCYRPALSLADLNNDVPRRQYGDDYGCAHACCAALVSYASHFCCRS